MTLLTDALALQHVPRWSVVRRSREQSVAEHSFAVAVIALELGGRVDIFGTARPAHLLVCALYHDVEESVTGDISSPAKRAMTMPKQPFIDLEKLLPGLTPTKLEHDIVKLADLIEAYTWLLMHGQGEHASDVALKGVGPQLAEYVKRFGEKVGAAVKEMIEEIESEAGRTRV